MKLSISNLAWAKEDDQKMYQNLKDLGYTGLEIAPTRLFDMPYEDLERAKEYALKLKEGYNLEIPSMQSIWYGRNEKIFNSQEERDSLIEYTKKAVNFAESIGCWNLVFGCPRNRFRPDGAKDEDIIPFFKAIGDYAYKHNRIIALEANPPIYNTNFLNGTKETLNYIRKINSKGIKLNLDVGTMIYNRERISMLKGNEDFINHIHISEPMLKTIRKRKLHQSLKNFLTETKYDKYISIEMGKQENTEDVLKYMKYIKEIFSGC